MTANTVIGITDCGSYPKYENWILKTSGVKTIRLSYKENNLSKIEQCHGVILSGGEDVHPRFYNRKEYINFCQDIDERRDDFEWSVLEYTEANQLPLLGICRGLQMANVFYGGTLIPDIPVFGKYNHSKFSDRDRYHAISVDPESLLWKTTGTVSGKVNSAHHQSADRIGRELIVNSVSPDGVIEGIERMNHDTAFFMLVQWHPERMTDQTSPFTRNIKNAFLEAARKLR